MSDTVVEQIAHFRLPARKNFETACGVYACEGERWITFEVGGGEGKYNSVTTVGLCHEHARQSLRSLLGLVNA